MPVPNYKLFSGDIDSSADFDFGTDTVLALKLEPKTEQIHSFKHYLALQICFFVCLLTGIFGISLKPNEYAY